MVGASRTAARSRCSACHCPLRASIPFWRLSTHLGEEVPGLEVEVEHLHRHDRPVLQGAQTGWRLQEPACQQCQALASHACHMHMIAARMMSHSPVAGQHTEACRPRRAPRSARRASGPACTTARSPRRPGCGPPAGTRVDLDQSWRSDVGCMAAHKHIEVC